MTDLTNGNDTYTDLNDIDEVINALDGDDLVNAQGGNDSLNGGNGNDTLNGGDGDDTLDGGDGFNVLDGGTGTNTVSYASAPGDEGISVDLVVGSGSVTAYVNLGSGSDLLSNIQNVIGSAFDDNIGGDDNNNALDGGDGNDSLDGGLLGDDTLLGGAGDDILYGWAGSDSLDGGAGANDIAVFEDNFSSYTFAYSVALGRWTITNTITGDTDILNDIETLQFSDGPKAINEVACFLRGTRVLTRAGYVPVESLRPGDEVQTLAHGWRPVQWLGQRHIPRNATGGFDHGVLPIRIAQGAFGAGLPARDLWLSPDHAVYFRDHLIPAKALVNGATVIREADVESITYYHVLLDRHAVVFSEGLPTESYTPQENLDLFENADSCPEPWRSSEVAIVGLLADCLPRAASGPVVETARAFLARRAPECRAAKARAG